MFADSLRKQEERLVPLETLRLEKLNGREVTEVGAELWSAVQALSVSVTESRIVTGTKTLHHFLPELVPPMDRRYTDGFFLGAEPKFNSLAFQADPAGAFAEIWPQMARLARQCERPFTDRIGKGMHTSLTKCLDNAIVGYILFALAIRLSASLASLRWSTVRAPDAVTR